MQQMHAVPLAVRRCLEKAEIEKHRRASLAGHSRVSYRYMPYLVPRKAYVRSERWIAHAQDRNGDLAIGYSSVNHEMTGSSVQA
jgi:hypothetical protein